LPSLQRRGGQPPTSKMQPQLQMTMPIELNALLHSLVFQQFVNINPEPASANESLCSLKVGRTATGLFGFGDSGRPRRPALVPASNHSIRLHAPKRANTSLASLPSLPQRSMAARPRRAAARGGMSAWRPAVEAAAAAAAAAAQAAVDGAARLHPWWVAEGWPRGMDRLSLGRFGVQEVVCLLRSR
jgi:hypothetical protein